MSNTSDENVNELVRLFPAVEKMTLSIALHLADGNLDVAKEHVLLLCPNISSNTLRAESKALLPNDATSHDDDLIDTRSSATQHIGDIVMQGNVRKKSRLLNQWQPCSLILTTQHLITKKKSGKCRVYPLHGTQAEFGTQPLDPVKLNDKLVLKSLYFDVMTETVRVDGGGLKNEKTTSRFKAENYSDAEAWVKQISDAKVKLNHLRQELCNELSDRVNFAAVDAKSTEKELIHLEKRLQELMFVQALSIRRLIEVPEEATELGSPMFQNARKEYSTLIEEQKRLSTRNSDLISRTLGRFAVPSAGQESNIDAEDLHLRKHLFDVEGKIAKRLYLHLKESMRSKQSWPYKCFLALERAVLFVLATFLLKCLTRVRFVFSGGMRNFCLQTQIQGTPSKLLIQGMSSASSDPAGLGLFSMVSVALLYGVLQSFNWVNNPNVDARLESDHDVDSKIYRKAALSGQDAQHAFQMTDRLSRFMNGGERIHAPVQAEDGEGRISETISRVHPDENERDEIPVGDEREIRGTSDPFKRITVKTDTLFTNEMRVEESLTYRFFIFIVKLLTPKPASSAVSGED